MRDTSRWDKPVTFKMEITVTRKRQSAKRNKKRQQTIATETTNDERLQTQKTCGHQQDDSSGETHSGGLE